MMIACHSSRSRDYRQTDQYFAQGNGPDAVASMAPAWNANGTLKRVNGSCVICDVLG